MNRFTKIFLVLIVTILTLVTTNYLLFKPDLPKLARLKNDVAEYATNLNSEIRANEILGLYSIPEVEEPKQELFGVRYFFVNGDTLDVVFFYRQTKQGEWILEKIE